MSSKWTIVLFVFVSFSREDTLGRLSYKSIHILSTPIPRNSS